MAFRKLHPINKLDPGRNSVQDVTSAFAAAVGLGLVGQVLEDIAQLLFGFDFLFVQFQASQFKVIDSISEHSQVGCLHPYGKRKVLNPGNGLVSKERK